jgi:hypothetical protein
MLDETDNLLRDIGAELVFGLVAPVGADLERLESDLVDLLGLYGYATNPIRLSARKVGDEALVRLPMPRTTYLEREARVVQLVTKLLQETP